jgi:hypothetical protein
MVQKNTNSNLHQAEKIKTEDNVGNFNVDITADEVETGKKNKRLLFFTLIMKLHFL